MSVSGDDFFKFANDCMQYDTEIAYRNAIGRSYYGLYHEVCSILKNCPETTHQGVAEYLLYRSWKGNEDYDKFDLKCLGTMLQQQHSKRKWADYDLSGSITKSEAIESIRVVEKMMNKIKLMTNVDRATS